MTLRIESCGISSKEPASYIFLIVSSDMPGASAGAEEAAACGAGAFFAPPPAMAAFTSRSTTRPCGPDPAMAETSIPASFASRRASGDAKTREPGAAAGFAAGAGAAAGALAGAGAEAAAGADAGACGAGAAAGAAFPAPLATDLASSPSPAMTAISSFTFTSCAPSGTMILASTPSSTASTSMVALSVSISAITSPDLIASPSFLSQRARLPFSMVGESAGMRMLMGMMAPQLILSVSPGSVERSHSASNIRRISSRACSSVISASSA